MFTVLRSDPSSSARLGRLETPHGPVETPAFMPVASQGTVKALTRAQLQEVGADIVLVNSYHLFLRPGAEAVRDLGGIHPFMSWPKPVLSDSGGFQIYSLSPLVTVREEGVLFASHLDGTKFLLRPEDVVDIQLKLGADVIMCLDRVPPYPSSREAMESAVALTSRWAARSKACFSQAKTRQELWAISQGGIFWDLRQQSIEELLEVGFSGYAYGGLGLGEPKTHLVEVLERGDGLLPRDRPRYLMGIGYVEDILEAVERGVDLFDCVLPTRNARNGTLFTSQGRISIKNQRYALDPRPIDESCACYTCRTFSRAYLRHLYEREEIGAAVLNTIHNLYYYLDIFRRIRQSIGSNSFGSFKRSLLLSDRTKDESR